MKPLRVKDLELNDGSFKICVPLTARNEVALMNDLLHLKGKVFDLIEWRADYYFATEEDLGNLNLKPLRLIRKFFSDKPLIVTFRDSSEGGQSVIDQSKLLEFRKNVIDSGVADLIDIELMEFQMKYGADEELHKEYEELLELAKERGVKVILSFHDFKHSPEVKEMLDCLLLEEEFGADLAKIAYFAKNETEAKTLMEASTIAAQRLKIPHIAIAMGEKGSITRYSRKESSSAITFASIGESSAPGQLSLDNIHDKLRE
ncbi:MAG: type I 3-dehydroquinate dehydratase [Clostridiaceae bacterium]